MLEVTALVAGYGPVRALDGVDLNVEQGSITAVLGANGAGKTTLLRAISGLLRPSAGTVRLDGQDVTGRAPEDLVRRGMAHVPEGRGVIVELTVEENLRLGGLWRRDRTWLREGVARMYELFPPLGERRARRAETLSGGERQMLAIARSLMSRPRLLLLDEPSLGLAPRVTAEIVASLAHLRDETGLTLLLVEQNASTALSVADRAVVLNFAQGGMLMITTFVAYTIVHHGGSYWLALVVAVLGGVVLGAVVERLLIRPVENRPPLDAVVVTFGLLILLQGLAGMIFGGTPRSYPPAFGIRGYRVGDRRLLFAPNDLWVVLIVCAVMVLLAVLFRWTSLGLRMRAAAFAPEVSRLLGVRVGRMLTIGWALAAGVGALAGVLIAPGTFVSPTAFDAWLVFGFTAAVIGGLDSPPGALVGGLSLGVVLSYISGYVGSDVVALGALVVLVAVLMVRPSGLFGTMAGRRV